MYVENKLIYGILIMLILISGCTNSKKEDSIKKGVLYVSSNIEKTELYPGETTPITITLSNQFSNSINITSVKLEPSISGIIYTLDSDVKTIEPNSTEKLSLVVNFDKNLSPRKTPYTITPIICFNYSQSKKGIFRISNRELTINSVNYLDSDNGPININIKGLNNFNINDKDKLDVTVSYTIPDSSIQGATNYYNSDTELYFDKGEYDLDSVKGALKLRTYEPNINSKNNYCDQIPGLTYVSCYFNDNTKFSHTRDLNFDVIADKTKINGEIESYFKVKLDYNFCIRLDKSYSITIKEVGK